MEDVGQDERWVRVVSPSPTRTQRYLAFAAAVRASGGQYLDATEVVGQFPTPNAAKSFTYRVNRGHIVAFRDTGFHARSEGCQVAIAYHPRRDTY